MRWKSHFRGASRSSGAGITFLSQYIALSLRPHGDKICRAKLILCVAMLGCCWLALLAFPFAGGRLSLVENGYEGLVVAISPEEEENPNLVESTKDLLTKASAELYGATRQRAYFKEVTILVPQTWNLDEAEAAVDETYEDAEFRVAPSNPAYGHNPYTIQVKSTL